MTMALISGVALDGIGQLGADVLVLLGCQEREVASRGRSG